MTWKRVVLVILVVLVAAMAGGVIYLRSLDSYKADGTLTLPILEKSVTVLRDEKGMPYIFAESLEDALRAQGFVTAQDRLLQMAFSRFLSQGRLAEVIGPAGLKMDIEARVLGYHRHGKRDATIINPKARTFIQLYVDGVNSYIAEQRPEYPLGLRLLGVEPEPWTVEDVMTLQYFLNWMSSVNLQTELITQMLIDKVGPERATELAQLNVNPDDELQKEAALDVKRWARLNLTVDDTWLAASARSLEVGSNNWVMSGGRSTTGQPILANDPHIDARQLPGIWHPVGLITPEFRAVGVAGPGVPGLAVGRTSHIAYGVTNAYGDNTDLFVETEDPENPGRYLEGEKSIPFDAIEEVIKIRDRRAEGGFREQKLTIRFTRRGPIISDHGMGLKDGKLLTVRWSTPEARSPEIGIDELLIAKTVDEARAAIGKMRSPYNYVVADTKGDIAFQATGRIPIRTRGDGTTPVVVEDGTDTWNGFIPWRDMPGVTNPARGWVGTANHKTTQADYPYYYSSYQATSYRYRRMIELLDGPGKKSPDDHWRFMHDAKNMMAEKIAPIMAQALLPHDDTKEMGEILSHWNRVDDQTLAAPTIFQATYRHFARRTYEDELGPELTGRMLNIHYFWQERLQRMVEENRSRWFDNMSTEKVETRDDLFHLAATDAKAELSPRLGDDPSRWAWGQVHTATFSSPIVPGKLASGILGGGTHPMSGSGETVYRAKYPFDDPYNVSFIASMHTVIDLSDPDKIMGVVCGGVSGRQFDPHVKDQLKPWLRGEKLYWWFSDKAIKDHAQSELLLVPPP
jgi:penicillin amidase